MGVYDIQGKNCVFQVKIGEDYKTVVCAKSFTFNPITDMKETTTVGSGFWKEFRPRKLSYTITFNGMHQVASQSTQETAKTLFTYQIQFLPLGYRIIYRDNSNNVMVVDGTVYVTSSLFDASPANLVNATQELQGTGAPVIHDEIPDLINMTVQVTGEADAKIRFVLYDDNGDIAYDTSTLPDTIGNSGWILQGETIVFTVQKGQYSWGFATSDVGSDANTFDLDVTPPANVVFNEDDQEHNSLPTLFDFLTDKTAVFDIGPDIPPPGCVAVVISGSPSLPNGTVMQPYTYSFPITGTPPFSLSNVTKPSWMNISVHETFFGSGMYVVTFGGLPSPSSAGEGIEVSLDIDNCSGSGSASFSDTIDVLPPAGTPSTINYSLNFTGMGAVGTLRIYVNGVQVVASFIEVVSSIDVNAGDIVQAQITGSTSWTKHLQVEDSIDGSLHDSTGTAVQSFSWTAELGHDYTITADVTT